MPRKQQAKHSDRPVPHHQPMSMTTSSCFLLHVVVTIVMPHPVRHPMFLIASLRRHVEQVVSADKRLNATSIGRERAEHIARLVLVEDADARHFVAVEARLPYLVGLEVVVDLARGALLGRKR